MMDYTAHYDAPLGDITLASDGTALIGLWFSVGTQASSPTTGRTQEYAPTELPVFGETCRWLDIYFAGQIPDFTPPLLLRGTAFQQHVWEALLTIPYGQTVTYGELARRLGCRSAQAVGGAVGRNSIAIIVPCHRVVGTGGSLIGYAAGLDRKRALLQLESHIFTRLAK